MAAQRGRPPSQNGVPCDAFNGGSRRPRRCEGWGRNGPLPASPPACCSRLMQWWMLGRLGRRSQGRQADMACGQCEAAPCESEPATARQSEEHPDAEELNVTPERVRGLPVAAPEAGAGSHETAAGKNAPCPTPPTRSVQEDEGKRRRLSSDDVRAAGLPAGSGAVAAPCPSTSATSADASSASCATSMNGQQPQPLTRQVEETLRAYLLRWGQRLVDLQPKVRCRGRRQGVAGRRRGGNPLLTTAGVREYTPQTIRCGLGAHRLEAFKPADAECMPPSVADGTASRLGLLTAAWLSLPLRHPETPWPTCPCRCT